MKQIIQNYYTGKIEIVEVPRPICFGNQILVENVTSLISVGTERSIIELGEKSLLGKALERPDLVKQVIRKVETEGVQEAYKTVMARLDNPVPLGYSCAGIVLEVGKNVEGIAKGDRVACAGSGYASHSEVVVIPNNLWVKIPENVDFESASFLAMGGIAMQAIRMAHPSLGDRIAVIGLGLLGQVTAQLLRTSGCHVFGIDVSEDKVKMALENGAERGVVSAHSDATIPAREFAPHGFDSVIIMAAAKNNQPLELASEIARERARIVATGLTGLEIPRKTFFEKELDLVVSRAWGPGVFDPNYTEKGTDYPYAYARWTAKRNLEEFLSQVSNSSVKLKHLITHRFPIEEAIGAYDLILKNKEPHIGVLITYPPPNQNSQFVRKIDLISSQQDKPKRPDEPERLKKPDKPEKPSKRDQRGKPKKAVGIIGAGLFAGGTLLPILRKMSGVELKGVATATGIKGQHIAKKYGFQYFTTDYHDLLKDPDVNLVFILTRHGTHAQFVMEALKAGKHVFVEKPLCLNESELNEIIDVYTSCLTPDASRQVLMVGFNRRFSPFSVWLKGKMKVIQEPLSIHCTVNAGYVPPNHWIHNSEEGGGRIIGEVCHFIDLIQFFTDSIPEKAIAERLNSSSYQSSENVSITLKMKNGSMGSILYVSNGDKRFPRERVEIFGGGAVGVIDNFRKASFTYRGHAKSIRRWMGIDRGHQGEMETFIEAVRNGENSPVSVEDYIYTTLTSFAAEESLRREGSVAIDSSRTGDL